MSNIRVYRYGLLAPTIEGKRVRDTMLAAHRYRNTLVEIERGRRAAIRLLMSEHGDIATVEATANQTKAVLVAALDEVKAARKASRARSDTESMRAAVTAARAAHKVSLAALRETRAAVRADTTMIAKRDAIEERAAELRRGARALCGAYWGTYLLVEDADMAARKAPLYDGELPNDPRFARWTGEGRNGVQIQGGMTIGEVHSEQDTRLQIRRPNDEAWTHPSRGRRHWYQRTVLRMRVGSDGRAPIWAEYPMLMHRPLPDGAVIKRAQVSLRKVGPREQWSVEITLDLGDTAPRERCGEGVVAVDIGWRKMGHELRVAAWCSDAGDAGEVRLPEPVIGAMRKVEDLRSIRDTTFNVAREALLGALGAMPADTPEWLLVATKTMHQWRSPARLAALARRWASARFDGDVESFSALEAWRYHDHHLWAWETSARTKALRRRKDGYRCIAAQLARRYRVLVLEDFDLRDVARKEPVEADKTPNEVARYARQLAAVSELRLALQQAFVSRGGSVVVVLGAYTTQTCNVCEVVEAFDAAAHVHHACTACGAVWDQDDNAAKNMLDRYCERLSRAADTAGAREPDKTETRWAKAKRMRAEKEARIDTARKAAGEATESLGDR